MMRLDLAGISIDRFFGLKIGGVGGKPPFVSSVQKPTFGATQRISAVHPEDHAVSGCQGRDGGRDRGRLSGR